MLTKRQFYGKVNYELMRREYDEESTQKVNFTTVTDKDGKKIKTSVSEARTMKKNNKKAA